MRMLFNILMASPWVALGALLLGGGVGMFLLIKKWWQKFRTESLAKKLRKLEEENERQKAELKIARERIKELEKELESKKAKKSVATRVGDFVRRFRKAKMLWLCAFTVLTAAFLCAGCATTTPSESTYLEKEIADEFNTLVKPASRECFLSVQDAFQQLKADIASDFRSLAETFPQKCWDNEGYFKRGTASTVLNDFLRQEVTNAIIGRVEAFEVSYQEDITFLESRLLVQTHLDALPQQYFKSLLRYAPEVNAEDIFTSKTVKVFDDLADWVPIAGDIYSVIKLIYNPREKLVKTRALRYVEQQQIACIGTIDAIQKNFPHYTEIERICRENFSAKAAVKQLEAE